MKRKLLKIKAICLAIAFATGVNLVNAQTFSQYTINDGALTYTGLNKNSSFAITGGDEAISDVTPIGFTFTYHSVNYTEFSASSNGFIQMGPNLIISNFSYNNDLANLDFNPIIAPLWDDMNTTDSVWYKVTGNAPNRILTVEWKNVTWNYLATNSDFDFKVRLYETSNAIEFQYGNMGISNSASASIGLNFSATDFLSLTPGAGGANPTVSTVTSDNLIDIFPGGGSGYFYTFTPIPGDFAPPISTNFAYNPALICMPTNVDVTTTISDLGSGVSSAMLWYSANGGAYVSTPLVLTSGNSITGNYLATIPPQAPASNIEYYIEATDTSGNSGNSTINLITYSTLVVDAGANQTINIGTTANLNATVTGAYEGNIKISEVVLYRIGDGATVTYPTYIDATAEDFIEITNLNTVTVALDGYTLEIYEGTTLYETYTLPSPFTLAANGVAVIHLGPGTDDVVNNYYHTGNSEDFFFSGSEAGFVLKSGATKVDVVATNSYTFPAISGVTSYDWSGNIPTSSGLAGVIRSGLDNNTAANWTVSDIGNEMTLGSLNPGLISVPVTLTYLWNPGGATTAMFTTPVLSATTTYTVTVDNGTCAVTDSVTVNTIAPTTPVAGFYASATNTYTATNVTLFDTSLNVPATWKWTITPNTFIYNSGSSSQVQNPVVKFLAIGMYTVKLVVNNASGMDSVTKVDYINVGITYCTPDYSTGTTDGDYIKGVRLATLNNWPTANDFLSYHDYYNTDSTTLVAGNTYTLSILNGEYPSETISAWIDYDNNGTFDAAEQLGTVFTTDTVHPYDIVFTTPAVIAATSARLRVRMAFAAAVVDPCQSYTWGETEDYRVNFADCALEPTVNLGNDTTVCGSTFAFNLDAGNTGASYVWQTGYNTQMITADTSGIYVVDVTYSDGCHGRDSISIIGIPFITPNANFTVTSANLVATFTNTTTGATMYSWSFGDGGTSTLAAPTYTYTTTGQYTVTLIASNECATDTQQFLISITNTGISNLSLKNNSVLVVPNPSNGQINMLFELLNTENVVAEVFNAIGAKVADVAYGKITGKQNVQLDLTSLPKGVYLLKLSSDGINKTQMISIQ